jgi:hypothetical protein
MFPTLKKEVIQTERRRKPPPEGAFFVHVFLRKEKDRWNYEN